MTDVDYFSELPFDVQTDKRKRFNYLMTLINSSSSSSTTTTEDTSSSDDGE